MDRTNGQFSEPVKTVSIIGGGSAGFIAALAMKTKLPNLPIRVIRSREIGIIGVGEGSTVILTTFLHTYLRLSYKMVQEMVEPSWKLGIRYLWGPRKYFNYTFGEGYDLQSSPNQKKPNGYYCDEDIEYTDLTSALMTENRVFPQTDGKLVPHNHIAYHLENEKFVHFLETRARAMGIEIVDDTVLKITPGPHGIESLTLKSGNIERADLFVDCSGFASILLGGAMKEPYISFKSSLFCERAVVGGWNRADSPDAIDQVIKPYTTAETMDSGWAWQIEHEHRINRGYVYSPDFISDEQAEAEFRRKNPRVGPTRIVKFISGRFERCWVGNVVAIGNASGFVEPLEATALDVICKQSVILADTLSSSDQMPRQSQIELCNRANALGWDSIRAFLAVHYKFNTRIDTPFWRHCWEATNLCAAESMVEYYHENGPDGYWGEPLLDNPQDSFRLTGYLSMMVGMQVPFHRTWRPDREELGCFNGQRQQYKKKAQEGFTVRQTLNILRSPEWEWK